MVTAVDPAVDQAWAILAEVPDPEVPVVSVVDLGIARDVDVSDDGRGVRVDITPTYSGCPAMKAIEDDVRSALERRFERVEVRTVLSPAWTTDWMSAEGKRKLSEFGIAPPHRESGETVFMGVPSVRSGAPERCPHCGSGDLERLSEFASTACKALYRCLACREPFDYFKAH
jgi:ring-1,2-phenylacetyl-CoA epoxidase subunit PaaD